jgi:ABC-type polar amino acid transport system ATPase subunit
VIKSKFCQDQLEYLGYVITQNGIQANMKKVEAILEIDTPKMRKQLRAFIGMVNHHRDLYPRHSHILALLSSMTLAKVRCQWTEVHQKAFNDIKWVIVKETLLAFPDSLNHLTYILTLVRYN